MWAAAAGHLPMVKFLVEEDANLDAKNNVSIENDLYRKLSLSLRITPHVGSMLVGIKRSCLQALFSDTTHFSIPSL